METTHGWYDEPLQWIGQHKTIRAMNIKIAYWPQLFSESDMYVQAKNIDAAAFMLKRTSEPLRRCTTISMRVQSTTTAPALNILPRRGARIGLGCPTNVKPMQFSR